MRLTFLRSDRHVAILGQLCEMTKYLNVPDLYSQNAHWITPVEFEGRSNRLKFMDKPGFR